MEDKMMGGYGLIIFLVLLFFVFNGGFGGGFGFNRGFGFNNYPTEWAVNGWGPSNCDIQKQELINTATTQFKVVDSARQTQEAAQAQFTALGNKIDFYEYQNLRDQLAQERTKNVVLENRVYSDSKFNSLEAQIAELACNTAKRPPFYAAGGNPCATIYPTGCGNSCSSLTPSLV